MEKKKKEMAELHLKVALELAGRGFIENWLATVAPALETATPKPARGRPAGAAAADCRCEWRRNNGGTQCKNTKFESSKYCRIHLSKKELNVIIKTQSAIVRFVEPPSDENADESVPSVESESGDVFEHEY
jgi:hypothetical protein